MTRYPVVVFDLDGTLLQGTTVSLLLAQWLGQAEEMAELERAFHAHEISNSVVADRSARWLAGQSTADAWAVLAEQDRYGWEAGIALACRGANFLIASVSIPAPSVAPRRSGQGS